MVGRHIAIEAFPALPHLKGALLLATEPLEVSAQGLGVQNPKILDYFQQTVLSEEEAEVFATVLNARKLYAESILKGMTAIRPNQ